jgi:hypothetical protein
MVLTALAIHLGANYCDGFLLLCLVRTVAEEESQKKLMARRVLTED